MTCLTMRRCLGIALLALPIALSAAAEAPNEADLTAPDSHVVIAVMDFAADDDLAALAQPLAALLVAALSAHPDLILIEPRKLDAALAELEFSGSVRPSNALAIGRRVGAKALVTGRLFHFGDERFASARILSAHTGRTHVESVSFPDDESEEQLAARLAGLVAASLVEGRANLIASLRPVAARIERLSRLTEGKSLPSISIAIEGTPGRGDAGEVTARTELSHILAELGFPLVDPGSSDTAPDIRIVGEALSEAGRPKGTLASASGWVALRAVDASNEELLAAEQQTEVVVDRSPQLAGRKALQRASGAVAERLVVSLVKDR